MYKMEIPIDRRKKYVGLSNEERYEIEKMKHSIRMKRYYTKKKIKQELVKENELKQKTIEPEPPKPPEPEPIKNIPIKPKLPPMIFV